MLFRSPPPLFVDETTLASLTVRSWPLQRDDVGEIAPDASYTDSSWKRAKVLDIYGVTRRYVRSGEEGTVSLYVLYGEIEYLVKSSAKTALGAWYSSRICICRSAAAVKPLRRISFVILEVTLTIAALLVHFRMVETMTIATC